MLPQGKYRFARLPQGSKPACDIFNIVSDPEFRDMKDIQKNMDDFLLSEENFKKLDPIIDRILAICQKRNMKLNPTKFMVGPEVEFGGTHVKYSPSNKRVQISPSEEKVEELLWKEFPKTKKELQSILGSLNQLTAWIPQEWRQQQV